MKSLYFKVVPLYNDLDCAALQYYQGVNTAKHHIVHVLFRIAIQGSRLYNECHLSNVCKYTAGVPMPVLVDVGRAISVLPQDLTWHRQIRRVYDQRRAMIDSGEGIDWAMAEALAFGTLVNEGAPPPP